MPCCVTADCLVLPRTCARAPSFSQAVKVAVEEIQRQNAANARHARVGDAVVEGSEPEVPERGVEPAAPQPEVRRLHGGSVVGDACTCVLGCMFV
jgi:hypothetical protein